MHTDRKLQHNGHWSFSNHRRKDKPHAPYVQKDKERRGRYLAALGRYSEGGNLSLVISC